MFTTGLSITLLLILLGTIVFSVLVAGNVSRQLRENLVVTILLDDNVDSIAGQRMSDILETKMYASQTCFISKEDALREQSEAMGLDPAEFLDANPFSASIELHLAAEHACTDSILKITRELEAMPNVTDVLCQRDLVERITASLQKAGYILLALAALLTIISFTLINNTVQLSIHSRRHAIHTMRLVGASWSFIRRPFVLSSMRLGLVASLISTAIIVGAAKALMYIDPSLQDFADDVSLMIVGATVIAAGLLLTMMCSYITVSRYLRMPHNAMY